MLANYNVIIKYIVVYIDTINALQKKNINFLLKKTRPLNPQRWFGESAEVDDFSF